MERDFVKHTASTSNTDFDVICVGAGMSGLTAGNILINKGYKVLILERNPKVGGCAVNFSRKGYRFDTAIHFINGCGNGGMINEVLKMFNAEDEIEFIQMKELMHWVDLKTGIDFHAPMLLEDYVEALVTQFTHEEDGIRKFYQKYSKVVRWLMDYIGKQGLISKIGHFLVRLPTSIRFLRTVYKPIGAILDKYLQDESLKETITSLCTSFGLFREEMSAISFLMAEMAVRFEGGFYPKGGAGVFSQKLADIFTAQGGHLLLKHKAVKLNIKGSIAKSIDVQEPKGNIKNFSGKQFIISSDVTAFATKLCPPGTLPDSYIKSIKNRTISYSNVICFLGLDIDLKEHGITDYILWRFGRSAKSLDNINNIIKNRDYSRLPIENIAIYSNIDPSCCPAGKSLLSAIYYTTMAPFKEFMEKDELQVKKYKEEKERIKQHFTNWISEALGIPDLEEAIEVCEIATPLTLEKFTGNREGANFGWRQTAEQLMKNPLNARTPLKNVILAGHWTFPGGGIASVMLSGYGASEIVRKSLK